MPAVQHHQHRRVFAAPADPGRLGAPVHQHPEAAHVAVRPVGGQHLGAGGVDPRHVVDAERLVELTGEKALAAQNRILVPQLRQRLDETHLGAGARGQIPVHPADVVVLAVGVVVALLRPRHFVAGGDHRGALRQQQRRQQVAHLPLAQRRDRRIAGRPFGAGVRRSVVGRAVLVVLAVRLVVLVVVGDEIVQREAIVRGDEVDRGPRLPPAALEQIRRRAQPRRERAGGRVPCPEAPGRVAELIVPLRPARRKAADLVAPGPAVPRLRDQLDGLQDRILAARLEESALIVEPVRLAREDRPEVEAEPVDVRFGDPVAQAVGHHLDHARMTQVQRVPGAGVVDVEARLIRQQPVVRRVVDPPERQRRPALVAFRGVVVDDVEDHLEAGIVAARHHLLELAQAVGPVRRVARIGREEAKAVVAPVVGAAALGQVALGDEGMDRQQFDAGDAERLDVLDDLRRAESGEGAALMFRHVGMQFRVAAHVRLVEHGVPPRHRPPVRLALPVEVRIDDDALGDEGRAVALVERQVVLLGADGVAEARGIPLQLAVMRARVRIEQQLVRIEAMTGRRLVRPVHAIAVQRRRTDAGHVAVPDLVGVLGQLDPLQLAVARRVEQADLDLGGVGGEQAEVDPLAVPGGAAGKRRSFAYAPIHVILSQEHPPCRFGQSSAS